MINKVELEKNLSNFRVKSLSNRDPHCDNCLPTFSNHYISKMAG